MAIGNLKENQITVMTILVTTVMPIRPFVVFNKFNISYPSMEHLFIRDGIEAKGKVMFTPEYWSAHLE